MNCLRTVVREEGAKRLWAGSNARWMFTLLNGTMFLYVYDKVVYSIERLVI